MSKKSLIILLIIIVASALLAIGYFYFTEKGSSQNGPVISNSDEAMDKMIKSSVAKLKNSAEFFATIHGKSYIGFEDSDDWAKAEKNISISGSKLIAGSIAEKNWAACAQLKSVAADYYCADSTGAVKEIKGQCDENWKYAKCP